MVSPEMRKCENCDRKIGRLEQVHDWQGHQLCRECRDRLRAATPLPSAGEDGRPRRARRPAPSSAARPSTPPEEILWRGSPSQITNLKTFALCGASCLGLWVIALWLVAKWEGKMVAHVTAAILLTVSLGALLVVFWRWMVVHHIRYEATTERLRIVTGVFSRTVQEVELYRIKDTLLQQPFFLRMFGLGHVFLITSDKTTPTVVIKAVATAGDLREALRKYIEKRRDKKRVREVDFE